MKKIILRFVLEHRGRLPSLLLFFTFAAFDITLNTIGSNGGSLARVELLNKLKKFHFFNIFF